MVVGFKRRAGETAGGREGEERRRDEARRGARRLLESRRVHGGGVWWGRCGRADGTVVVARIVRSWWSRRPMSHLDGGGWRRIFHIYFLCHDFAKIYSIRWRRSLPRQRHTSCPIAV
jgi:hypothetical protein